MGILKRTIIQSLVPAAVLSASFIAGGVFIIIIGQDPLTVYGRFFSQTLGSWYGIGQILFKSTPIIFTGLSAAIGFRSGLFNIGAEGQLTAGALLTAIVGFSFSELPSFVLIPFCITAGVFGGAVWGAIPGFLKAKYGSHEVINTIMMNFIAAGMASYIVINVAGVTATVHTPEISGAAQIPRLELFSGLFRGSPVNLSFFIAIICCIILYILLWKTRMGFELRALGLNPSAAEYAGIDRSKRIILAMTLAGGFAGLVGTNFVLGYKHYFELGFSEGIGFIGIAVALLGKNHPVGIIFTSLFFGLLEYGSLTINTLVPKELSNILQAIVIILMISLSKIMDRRFKTSKNKIPVNADARFLT